MKVWYKLVKVFLLTYCQALRIMPIIKKKHECACSLFVNNMNDKDNVKGQRKLTLLVKVIQFLIIHVFITSGWSILTEDCFPRQIVFVLQGKIIYFNRFFFTSSKNYSLIRMNIS